MQSTDTKLRFPLILTEYGLDTYYFKLIQFINQMVECGSLGIFPLELH